MIYDHTFNILFQQKTETNQYNAALAITGAIRGSTKERLYQELGFKTFQERLWFRKLLFLQNTKIAVSEVPFFNYSYTQ